MESAIASALIRQSRGRTSRDEFGAQFGVTGEAVRQWEAGARTPRPVTARAIDHRFGLGGRLLAAYGYADPAVPAEGPTLAEVSAKLDHVIARMDQAGFGNGAGGRLASIEAKVDAMAAGMAAMAPILERLDRDRKARARRGPGDG